MTLTDEQLDLCFDKLKDIDNKELSELIDDLILKNWTQSELISFIDDNFTPQDWEWFFEEYVKVD